MILSSSYSQRFAGVGRLYGNDALSIFSQAHVCVIGVGGVGSWVAEALARTGIGFITLIDMDDVCISNTNRQLHTLSSTIGQAKTEVMADRIKGINPDCQVTCIDDFIGIDNMKNYLTNQFDYVIDAIDSVRAKAAVIYYCRRHKIPILTVGGAGGQIDPTQIQVVDLGKTVQDPLVAKVRERLKSDFNMKKNSKGKYGIDCVFSTESLKYPQEDGSVCAAKPQNGESTRMDCAKGFGAVTMVTATFGFIAVSRVLSKLLAKKLNSK